MRFFQTHGNPLSAAIIFIMVITGTVIADDIDSFRPNGEVTIDGAMSDWEGRMYSFDDDNVNIGVMNDDSYLYLCITPLDQIVARQAIAAGMIVWIESKAKKKFGIKYPVGISIADFKPGEMRQQSNSSDDVDPRQQHRETSLKEIQIINKDKETIATIPVVNLMGISAIVETRNDRFVYELQFPIKSTTDFPYAVEAKDGEKIKVEIETLEFDKNSTKKSRGGGRGSGGGDRGSMVGPPSGGGGAMGGPPGGGMGGGERPNMPDPLKLKLKVKLAKNGNGN